MRRLYPALMLCMAQLIAQNVVYLPGDPRYKAPTDGASGAHQSEVSKGTPSKGEVDGSVPKDIPEFTFTLPIPRYKIPKGIQNLIMFSVTTDRTREAVLRDEYKNIYKDKANLKKWLNESLDAAITAYFHGRLDLLHEAKARGDFKVVADLYAEAGEGGQQLFAKTASWQRYASSNW